MKKKILIIIIAVIVLVIAICLISELINNNKQIACTQEAKICPDGSSVGRTGPNCEFTLCPESTPIAGWKTSTDNVQGITFQYPEKLLTTFMHPVEWPPKVTVTTGTLSCSGALPTNNLFEKNEQVIINNHIYCVKASSEGAAGSTFVTYNYSAEISGKLITVNFVMQYPQCMNYDDPQQTLCKTEQSTFDLAGIIDKIIQNVKVK